MLGGMQFGVLVEALFCELDGWVSGGMQFGVLVEVLHVVHHDAVRSTMMLLNRFGRCCCSKCRE